MLRAVLPFLFGVGISHSPHGLGSVGGVAIGANTQISCAFALAPTAVFRGSLALKFNKPGAVHEPSERELVTFS